MCSPYPPGYQPVTQTILFNPTGPLFDIFRRDFLRFANLLRCVVDNNYVTKKQYNMSTKDKLLMLALKSYLLIIVVITVTAILS